MLMLINFHLMGVKTRSIRTASLSLSQESRYFKQPSASRREIVRSGLCLMSHTVQVFICQRDNCGRDTLNDR